VHCRVLHPLDRPVHARREVEGTPGGAYNPVVTTPLESLERQMEGLIERSLPRLLGSQFSVPMIAGQLARTMEDGLSWDERGKGFAPDQYALTLHPEDIDMLLAQASDLRDELAQGLAEAARSLGYGMSSEPEVTLAADPTLARWDVRVVAWHRSRPLEFTQGMPREARTEPGHVPSGAFLIVDGGRHFPLDRPVVNIGRRLDNQIILEDPHVSRTHAQLRVREGKFVLFDLGSTAGTQVNGKYVEQHVLRPGDVIRVGASSLVYGEDPGGPPDSTPAYSPPFPPWPAGDQQTHAGRAPDVENE
jgi:FHA domain/FhaA, N-terminal domain